MFHVVFCSSTFHFRLLSLRRQTDPLNPAIGPRERRKLPSRVLGGATAANAFWRTLIFSASGNASGGCKFCSRSVEENLKTGANVFFSGFSGITSF